MPFPISLVYVELSEGNWGHDWNMNGIFINKLISLGSGYKWDIMRIVGYISYRCEKRIIMNNIYIPGTPYDHLFAVI